MPVEFRSPEQALDRARLQQMLDAAKARAFEELGFAPGMEAAMANRALEEASAPVPVPVVSVQAPVVPAQPLSGRVAPVQKAPWVPPNVPGQPVSVPVVAPWADLGMAAVQAFADNRFLKPADITITQAELDRIGLPSALPPVEAPVAYRFPVSAHREELDYIWSQIQRLPPSDWQSLMALQAKAQQALDNMAQERRLWESRLQQNLLLGEIPYVSPDKLKRVTLANGDTYLAEPYTGEWLKVPKDMDVESVASSIAESAYFAEKRRAEALSEHMKAMALAPYNVADDEARRREEERDRKLRATIANAIAARATTLATAQIKNWMVATGMPPSPEEARQIYSEAVETVRRTYQDANLLNQEDIDWIVNNGPQQDTVMSEATYELDRRKKFADALLAKNLGFPNEAHYEALYRHFDGELPEIADSSILKALIQRALNKEFPNAEINPDLDARFYELGDSDKKRMTKAVEARLTWLKTTRDRLLGMYRDASGGSGAASGTPAQSARRTPARGSGQAASAGSAAPQSSGNEVTVAPSFGDAPPMSPEQFAEALKDATKAIEARRNAQPPYSMGGVK